MDYCSCCGAKTVRHKHNLNKGMAESLIKLCRVEKAALKTLNLTHNQWENFQKLKYWGLVEKYYEDGKRLGGWWEATEKAYQFVDGLCSIPKNVRTFRNNTVEESSEKIFITDIITDYKYKQREDYVRDAESVGRDLFSGELNETY